MKNLTRQQFLKTGAALLFGSAFLTACSDQASPGPILPATRDQATTTAPNSTSAPTTAPATTNPAEATATVLPPTNPASTVNPPLTTTTTSATGPQWQIGQLDQAAKVGQRMLVVFDGQELTPAIANFLLTVKPGGIVMFANNIGSLAQIKKLNADLQALAAKNGLPPFIITLDEEGGIVSRMPAEAAESIAPAQMAQGAAGLDAVRDCAHETAVRLANLGFNLNLAPDADVNSNYQNPVIGTRSFGSQPRAVATAVRTAIGEYLGLGVGTCVKHFPGHGDTATDSHTGLPVVRKTRQQLNELELVPFVEAISAGTPAIMTAHILFPQIEPNGLPATLSPYFLKQVLRDELKYDGLILTDSLSMGAISNQYGLAEAGRLALVAGADMIIAIGTLQDQIDVYNTLLAAAKKGQFETDRPAERILAFKNRFALPQAQPSRPANPTKLAQAAQNSITLLRNDDRHLPIRSGVKPLLVNLALAKATQAENQFAGQPPRTLLSQLWQQAYPGQSVLEVSIAPTAAEISRAQQAVQKADLAVIVTRDAYDTPAQTKLLQTLTGQATPIVIVAVRGPYDLLAAPQAANYLATYSDSAASVRALLNTLQGRAPLKGKLPVAIPGLYEVGAGRQLD